MPSSIDGFYIAPHVADGSLVGTGFWRFTQLSNLWLEVAQEFLQRNGSSFRASWGDDLASFETRFTESHGAALCTFFVDGHVASSHLYLSGLNLAEESEVTSMFIESLRRVRSVQLTATSASPFEEVRRLRERPLDIAVVWSPEAVDETKLQMVRELSVHLAAAFFLKSTTAH